jgi:hypothetical protein
MLNPATTGLISTPSLARALECVRIRGTRNLAPQRSKFPDYRNVETHVAANCALPFPRSIGLTSSEEDRTQPGSVRLYPLKIPVILCSRFFTEATGSYKCSEADTA